MEQEKFEMWMMEYLSGELDESRQIEFENYLKEHPDYQQQFDAISGTWKQVDMIEVPKLSQKNG